MAQRMRRWTAGALVVVAVALVAMGAFRSQARADPARPRVQTPLWSVRRLPGPIVDPVNAVREQAASAALQGSLDQAVAGYGSACFVVERGSKQLAARNAGVPLIPASTQKLVTAAAALAQLGADFRFETNVVATSDGPTLDRLWFVGAGDPVIRTEEYMDVGVSTPLESLADAIVARGVVRIGSVVGDDSRFDGQRFLPSWSPSYRLQFDIGPVGALTVTQGIWLVNGRPVMADDPAQFAAAELTRLLRARGVAVGEPTRGVAPSGAKALASVRSEPLRVVVGWMLATSDNLTAEMLTKELGVRTGNGGNTTAGVDVIQAALRRLGVPLEGQVMVDGSGLDRGNRMTCRALADVLALGSRPDLRVLRDTLPGAGAGAVTAGQVRAKGGYLTDVTALAGIVTGDTPLRFSFIANGGVPKNANVNLAAFADTLVKEPRPVLLSDDVVPAPASPEPTTKPRRRSALSP